MSDISLKPPGYVAVGGPCEPPRPARLNQDRFRSPIVVFMFVVSRQVQERTSPRKGQAMSTCEFDKRSTLAVHRRTVQSADAFTRRDPS
jgi:hypothetical protein